MLTFFCTLLLNVAASRPTFLVVLDPGHTPQKPGATGVTGKVEVAYNDALAVLVKKELETDVTIQVVLTRDPNQEIELLKRPELANDAHASVFVALHHDSAHLDYLDSLTVDGHPAYRTKPSLRSKYQLGFSLFVSKKNPEFVASEKLAEHIGQELVAANRPISTYHTEKIENEGRVFLEPTLGIYQYDDLVVLKHAHMPAVLVESAVIVDPQDESYISRPENRQRVATAIAHGIESYLHAEAH